MPVTSTFEEILRLRDRCSVHSPTRRLKSIVNNGRNGHGSDPSGYRCNGRSHMTHLIKIDIPCDTGFASGSASFVRNDIDANIKDNGSGFYPVTFDELWPANSDNQDISCARDAWQMNIAFDGTLGIVLFHGIDAPSIDGTRQSGIAGISLDTTLLNPLRIFKQPTSPPRTHKAWPRSRCTLFIANSVADRDDSRVLISQQNGERNADAV